MGRRPSSRRSRRASRPRRPIRSGSPPASGPGVVSGCGSTACTCGIPPTDKTGGRMVFPQVSAPQESLEVRQSPCLQQAARLTMAGLESYDALVHALVAGCRTEDLTVRLTASTTAANLLLSADRYDEALRALEAARVPEAMTVRGGAAAGRPAVPAHRLADAADQAPDVADRTEEALDLAGEGRRSALRARGPGSPRRHPHMRDSCPRSAGRDARGRRPARARFRRADRRVYAYVEVVRKLLRRGRPRSRPRPAVRLRHVRRRAVPPVLRLVERLGVGSDWSRTR